MTRLTLAPVVERRDKRGRRIGRNWWREWCMSIFLDATLDWERRRDEVCIGYATEEAAFERDFPRPNLKDILVANAGFGMSSDRVA